MKKNMGNADRFIRIFVAVIFAILYLTNTITGTLGIVFLAIAIIFLLTSFISFCPLYTVIGVNTCGRKK
ncbi:MAG: DUF2892 domain-containing protein [Ignavibacteria bacterium]|nr:DUF2892 domain-containing protein [Ignavibacteria bacterium]MBK7445044.1 DUF2892 domain-containing protein [Ignavibacteria bacterium]